MIFVALGANVPFRDLSPVDTMRAALGQFPAYGLNPVTVSRVYASPAWPDPADPPFVNAVAAVATGLSAEDSLAALHRIEDLFGRRRLHANAPRTLDLDLLDHGGAIRRGPGLVLPHPRLSERAFVLLPLQDVAAGWQHPETGASLAALIAALPAGWVCTPVGTLVPPRG